MSRSYQPAPRRPARRALAALALFALLPLLMSAPATGTSMLATCTDSAWSDYNTCLVDSSTWWMRTGCDVGFSADYAYCWAKYAGEFRGALM